MTTPTEIVIQILKGELVVGESSQVAYGDGFGQVPNEKELLKAHLLVELIERHKYPLEAISVDAYIPVSTSGVRYAQLDMVVRDRPGNPVMLIGVEPSYEYEKKLEESMQRLFAAAVVMREKAAPKFLLYYTHWYATGGVRNVRQMVVDYIAYQTYEAWNKAHRPTLPNIPQNQ